MQKINSKVKKKIHISKNKSKLTTSRGALMCLTRAEVHWFSPNSRWCTCLACSTSKAGTLPWPLGGALPWPLGPSSSISFHPLGNPPPFITPTISVSLTVSVVFISFFFLLKKGSLEDTLTSLESQFLPFLYQKAQMFTRVMYPSTSVFVFLRLWTGSICY